MLFYFETSLLCFLGCDITSHFSRYIIVATNPFLNKYLCKLWTDPMHTGPSSGGGGGKPVKPYHLGPTKKGPYLLGGLNFWKSTVISENFRLWRPVCSVYCARFLEKCSMIAKNYCNSREFSPARGPVCWVYCARLLESAQISSKTIVIPGNFRLQRAVWPSAEPLCTDVHLGCMVLLHVRLAPHARPQGPRHNFYGAHKLNGPVCTVQ